MTIFIILIFVDLSTILHFLHNLIKKDTSQ